MIERKFIADRLKEQRVQEFIASQLGTGYSRIEIKRTPLGERIIVYTTKPGLLVGRRGENIKSITKVLKTRFKMENPQMEIGNVENPLLDAYSVADNIKSTFERFGPKRFKYVSYNMLENVMRAGALGVEIVISGRGVPGRRAKSWRFITGHLKKSGDISENYVQKAHTVAQLKTGAIGIKVKILHSTVKRPDMVTFKEIAKEEKDGKEARAEADAKEPAQ